MSEEIVVPPSMQEPILGRPEAAFTEQIGPGITEEFINTLNQTNLPDTSSGELIPIGEDLVATLRTCKANGTWPDWLKWFKEEMPKLGGEVISGRICAAIDRAKWGQTVKNVLLEIHCRSNNLMVVQVDKDATAAVDSGAVLPMGVVHAGE